MTAASVVARAFALAAPLPFLNAVFPAETVAFWLTVVTFQSLAGAFSGIVPTVTSQMIAFARTGSSAVGGSIADHARSRVDGPNWPLIAEIGQCTTRLFRVIALAWIVFAGVIGTWIIWRPMTNLPEIPDAALAWAIFIPGVALRLLAQPFASFSLGFGEIAAIRRFEALSWLSGGVGVIAILSIAPSLTLAMIAMQAPILLNFVQYRRLAYRLGWRASEGDGIGNVQRELWARAWRGSVAALTSLLTTYGSGLVFVQVGEARTAAAYLLGINVLGIVGQIAFSPVNAASPALAARFAQGQREEMNDLAQRAMGRSMWTFVFLAIAAPVGLSAVNLLLSTPIDLPDPPLWIAMCLSAIFFRHSANHLFVRTTTNDIRGHIINPVFLVLSLGPFLVLPASNVMLLVGIQGLATVLVHFPYSRWLTWGYLGYGLRRELRDFILPLAAMLIMLGAWSFVWVSALDASNA